MLTRVCAKTGDSEMAKKLLLKMKRKELGFSPNKIDCTQIIQALNQKGRTEDAISILEFMEEQSIKPDSFTYSSLLSACTNVGHGKMIHNHIIKNGIEFNIQMQTALLNMYSK